MTSIPIRIKVRCPSCSTRIPLSQEQYRELLKQTRLTMACPHCGHDFEYKSVPSHSQPQRREAEADFDLAPDPLPFAQEVVPEFPPPPFAPLGGGMPAKATPPPFAAMSGAAFAPTPAAPPPQGAAAPSGGEANKLTLNERWKRLHPSVQWTVIGVAVVILAVVIFAPPPGGSGNGSADAESKANPGKTAAPEKQGANDGKKASEKAAKDNRNSQEGQP